jgi:predicted permease
MTWLRATFARMLALVTGRARETTLDAEITAHLDLLTDDYLRAGLSPEEARAAARRAFGGIGQLKEAYRDERRGAILSHLFRDARQGLRGLRRNPGFSLVAIVTLALGVAVNATVFNLVNALLFRPLPVRDADRLTVFARQRRDGTTLTVFSPREFDLLRSQAPLWSHLVSVSGGTYVLLADGTSDRVGVSFVSENYWDAFGLQPTLGTFFRADDPATASSLVLGYDYWRRHFRADPAIVGKTVTLGGMPLAVAGVAPAGFHGDSVFSDVKGFVPRHAPGFLADRRPGRILGFLARGTTLTQANASLDALSTDMARARRESPADIHLGAYWERLARPAPHAAKPEMSTAMFFALLATLVLGLACVNVTSLILIRVDSRSGELAVRTALGASRTRVAWHLFIETFVLVVLAGVAGVALGQWVTVNVGRLLPTVLAPFARELRFDWRSAALTLTAVSVTAIGIGLLPALRGARSPLQQLRKTSPSVTGGGTPIRRALMALQIAAALVLLVVAGLFARSLASTREQSFGFDRRGVLDFSMNPAEAGTGGGVTVVKRLEAIRDQVAAMPGVESAALTQSVPMTSSYSSGQVFPDDRVASTKEPDDVGYSAVSPTYFETLRIPINAGRPFSALDTSSAPRVAIVNATMAAQYWPHGDAIGRTFRVNSDSAPPVEVVGVVGDILNYSAMQDRATPLFYLPLEQHPTPSVTLQLRSGRSPTSVFPEVSAAIRVAAPDVVLFNVQTMADAISESPDGLFLPRLGAWLATGFGLVGLILSMVGVYGVVAYGASQRTRELALRIALGATPHQIRRNVLSIGGGVVLVGLSLGVGLAAALARVTAELYFGVSPLDTRTFVGATLLVGATAFVACYVPARRAMRIDPVVALKES